MGASPLHPTRDGRPWTHPPVTQSTFSGSVPVKRRETISPTGTAANAAGRMQSIRENAKTRQRRKLAFSLQTVKKPLGCVEGPLPFD